MNSNNAQKRLRILMFIYAAVFYIGGLQFYLGPDKLLTRINTVGGWLGFEPVVLGGERFWLFLTVSMMFTIGTCSLIAALNICKNHLFIVPVLVSKLTSSSLGMVQFVHVQPRGFAYLVIFLTDFPLFVLAVWFYIKALRSGLGEAKACCSESGESVAGSKGGS